MTDADALPKSERERVRSAVLGGRPTWDEPSAQYAVVVARAAERSHPFGVVASTVFFGVFAIALTAGTVALILDGSLLALFTGAFALMLWPSAIWLPFAMRTIRRTPRLNAHHLPDGFTIPAATPAPRRRRGLRLVGKVIAGAVVFGATRVVFLEVFSGDESTGEAFTSGVIAGMLFVVCGEASRAVARRRQSR